MKISSTYHLTIFGMMCRSVGSEYSKRVETSMREGGLSAALAVERPSPSEYTTPDSFRDDYLISSYLSKYELSSDNSRLENEAITQYKDTERTLATVNLNLRRGSSYAGVEGIISDARRKISSILGFGKPANDSLNLNEFAACVDWGPGATSTLMSKDSQLDNKILERQLGVTRRALKYAHAYLRYDTSFVSARFGFPVEQCSLLPGEFHVHEYDRFTTVPKSWKSRRSIAIQPTLNLFLQKGIGRMIRKRLRRDGIDLDDQSRNQSLAHRAFLEHYATIDLAKASDSVSTELVRLLLPPEWFEIMDDLRTHYTKIGDDLIRLEKFSAMGNGFTFELESLIFYALCWAVVRKEANDQETEIAVYGDDIIVASKHAARVIDVLSYCGFSTNVDKTFVDGPFYESCGKHFFNGQDVSPVYQKKVMGTLPELIRAHNRLFRWCTNGSFFFDRFRYVLDMLSQACTTLMCGFNRRKRLHIKCPRIPWWLDGDDGLLSNETFKCDQNSIFHLKVLSFQPSRKTADNYALLATTFRKGVVVSSPYMGLLSLRGVGKYQIRTRRVLRVRSDVLAVIS
jgi:hypothetical protein